MLTEAAKNRMRNDTPEFRARVIAEIERTLKDIGLRPKSDWEIAKLKEELAFLKSLKG